MEYAIINGKVVNEECTRCATLILKDGKIADIVSADKDYQAKYPQAEIIDAKGQYVVPGGIDGHVHFGGFGNIPIADDAITGSRAALAGGTTSVVDFSEGVGCDCIEWLRKRKADLSKGSVDYAFHFTFTENYENEIPRIPEILEEGVNAFKAYTYYDGLTLQAGDFRVLMENIHDKGPILIHAEEKSIIDTEKKRFKGDPKDMSSLYATRPNVSEQIAVETVLAIAKETGTRLAIAHTSSGETAEISAREKAAGNKNFLLESTPSYLQFTAENSKGEFGAFYTINPPLRSEKDRIRLREAAIKEEIDFYSTDHCPYLSKYKLADTTYETVPCGVDGVQTRMPYLFSEMVVKGDMTMEAFVRLTSTNCAKFYGLYPCKGTIAIGSDADLAMFDPEPEWVYTKEEAKGATDYTIFEGLPLKGKCTCTIKGGEIVMKDGVLTAKPGTGCFLDTVRK